MPSTYTTNLGIEKIATGEQSGTWGTTTNTNLDLIDQAVNGVEQVTLSVAGSSGSPNDLPITNGASSDGRNKFIEFVDGADLGGTAYVQLTPNDAEKIVFFRNSLSASRSVIVFQGTYNASNDFEIPNGADVVLKFDGAGAGAVVSDVYVNLTPTKLTTANLVATTADINGGSVDGATLGTNSAITEAQIDNININGNTISSTDTNGNITLAPNGTGVVALSSTDLTFGDNDKAIFGAGSDLQIYHDGSTSYINENGTGDLRILATDLRIINSAENENLIRAFTNGAVDLFYAGNVKLATTATGIDVTGTAVTDGLTVAGNVSVDGGTIKLDGNYPVGTNNVALGDTALDSVTSGGSNTAIGANASTSTTTGTDNTVMGTSALLTNTSGSTNTAIGRSALYFSTTASSNTAVGYHALLSNTTGTLNTGVGFNSLTANTTGRNTAYGAYSLTSNTTGSRNTGLGDNALQGNTSGGDNVAVGYLALGRNTTASNNTAVGYVALEDNTTGTSNTAVGYTALASNTTGVQNTATGYNSAKTQTTANNSTAYGHRTLEDNTGDNNTALGSAAMQENTSGANNTAVGFNALLTNTTGASNTAVGRSALYANTTASNNTALGYEALLANTTGFQNIGIGNLSGDNITTGIYNICIGYNTDTANATDNQSILISADSSGAVGKGSDTGFINPNGGGVYQGNNSSSWSTTSDERLKKNIVDNTDGLDKINAIQVRNFEYRTEDEITELDPSNVIKIEGTQLGVIAQEIQQVCPHMVKEESTGVLSVDTDNLVWYLINAVKELSAKVEALENA